MSVVGQQTVYYDYDGSNRLSQISRGDDAVSITYDAAGRRNGVRLPNGVGASYSYDQAGHNTSIIYKAVNGDLLAAYDYAYDANGRRTLRHDRLGESLLSPPSVEDATYDQSNKVVASEGRSFTYDENGNLTSDGIRTYAWNVRNQLVATSVGGETEFVMSYDALGRRIAKSGKSTKIYAYDGENVAVESVGDKAFPMLNGLGVDERYARGAGPDEQFYLVDALGSATAITDPGGNITERYTYSEYGVSDNAPGPSDNQYMFTGREYDADDIYYYRARYYQPSLGRFISEDPLGLASDRINFYGYAGDDPVSRVDPLGLKDFRDQCVGRYASCSPSQDPNGSTVGNWLKWKGCKASFDWGIREGQTAGTQIACDSERQDCLGGLVQGELDENDPLAIKCSNEYRKCMLTAGKKEQ